MLSSKFISEQLELYGELVLECNVYISQGIHDGENKEVLKSACALLNSGGGLMRMHNVEHAGKVQSKDLDTWWSGMESNFADILSGDDLCNYFDFIGNFDDPDLYLFVKTAEHLCTINYHCRLPTDTATHTVTYASAVKLLSRTGEPSPLNDLPAVPKEYQYGQIDETLKQEGKQIQFKHLSNNKERKSFAERVRFFSVKYVSAFANHYGGHVYFGIEDSTSAVLGEVIEAGTESKITNQVQRMMHEVIWGDTSVRAERGKHWDIHFYPVINCPQNERRQVVVVSVCKFPGGVFTACPDSYIIRHGTDGIPSVEQLSFPQWKAEMLNDSRVRADLQSRFVKVPLHTPFSRLVYTLPHTLQAARDRVLKFSTGCNVQPAQFMGTLTDSLLVRCIQGVMATFAAEPHLALPLQCWRTRLTEPSHEDLRCTLLIVSQHYGVHLVLFATSYLNSADLWKASKAMALEVKAKLVKHGGCHDRLAIKLHVLSLGDPLIVENFQASIDSSIYPPTYLLTDSKLDNLLTSLLVAISSYSPCQQVNVPPSPSLPSKKMASKSPSSPSSPPLLSPSTSATETDNVYFLLTCDQLELLWSRQFTKELWIHGPPGAGKTVAALEMIRELVARGCNRKQVLYIAENPMLCAYIRSFHLCRVASRRELMELCNQPKEFTVKYKHVKNVIVDEAQNFKDRDGDWYTIAEQLTTMGAENMVLHGLDGLLKTKSIPTSGGAGDSSTDSSKDMGDGTTGSKLLSSASPLSKKPRFSTDDLTGGYFWVFMDYAQKVHKFQAGLPGLIGKNNFMLSEISRNSKEIFDYAMRFMDRPGDAVSPGKEFMTDKPVLGHSYENGKGVEVMKCDKDSVHRTLFSVLESYLGSGVKLDDIAILVSKRGEKVALEHSISQDLSNSLKGSDCSDYGTSTVTVDTVRGFSGLDKSVVIGLDPHADERHADLDKFIVNLATRAKDGLVIITTSDELMEKLRAQ